MDPVQRLSKVLLEGPCWVERQRLRRILQALVTYERTESQFLLEWARAEILMIVRDE